MARAIAVALMGLVGSPVQAEPLPVSGPECGPLQKSPPFVRSIPPGTWGELKAREQGVLIVGDSPWGTLVHAAGPSYALVSGSWTPWAPYVWPDGALPTQQLRGPEVSRVGSQALNPKLPNSFGLTKAAYLVDVKVNGGNGSNMAREIVVSDLRLLDGTPAFPWQLSDVLSTLHARYRGCLTKGEFSFDAAVKGAGERFAKSAASRPPKAAQAAPQGPDTVDENLYVTWDARKQSLSVVFSSALSHRRCFTRQEWVQPLGSCPRGAPCLPGHNETVTACGGYRVNAGFELAVDAKGARRIAFLPPVYGEGAAVFEGADALGAKGPVQRVPTR